MIATLLDVADESSSPLRQATKDGVALKPTEIIRVAHLVGRVTNVQERNNFDATVRLLGLEFAK